MRDVVYHMIDTVGAHLVTQQESPAAEKVPGLAESIELARREWLAARSYFNSVTDPDLVDHAIYAVDAAEKKYMYLLKKARKSGLSLTVRDIMV